MPRKKLSEYRSKAIINAALGLPYKGWSFNDTDSVSLGHGGTFVVKVDQAVKGRFKKGLVFLNVTQGKVASAVETLVSQGYSSILVEPHIEHEVGAEMYISYALSRRGYLLSYSSKGGVDIESNSDSIVTVLVEESTNWESIAEDTKLTTKQLASIFELIKRNHFSFMEINPYVVNTKGLVILDCAVEVDDTGLYSVTDWSEGDYRNPKTEKETPEENKVAQLDKNSPASFNLSVLNPNGSIFLLLSGGGASVVIADEIHNVGMGSELANYGEYSGNPNADEAYIYTQQVLSLVSKSKAKQKILFIGGAAANFTDIANTFNGVIKAIDEAANMLRENKVSVYVRRGGPRQEIGLAKIKDALESHRLLGGVYDPSTSLTEALNVALKGLK